MNRRGFMMLLGGTAAAWPLAARAQQSTGVPRIGFVTGAEGAEQQARFAAFRQGLEARGWIDGRNLKIVVHFGAADPTRNRRYIAEQSA